MSKREEAKEAASVRGAEGIPIQRDGEIER